MNCSVDWLAESQSAEDLEVNRSDATCGRNTDDYLDIGNMKGRKWHQSQ